MTMGLSSVRERRNTGKLEDENLMSSDLLEVFLTWLRSCAIYTEMGIGVEVFISCLDTVFVIFLLLI